MKSNCQLLFFSAVYTTTFELFCQKTLFLLKKKKKSIPGFLQFLQLNYFYWLSGGQKLKKYFFVLVRPMLCMCVFVLKTLFIVLTQADDRKPRGDINIVFTQAKISSLAESRHLPRIGCGTDQWYRTRKVN